MHNILSLLEKLAQNTPYSLSFENCILNQPEKIREAFLTNNANKLKILLGNTLNLADRDEVVLIKTQ